MSLITCPECSHIVSNKAISCPGCGYPIANGSVTAPEPLPVIQKKHSPRKKLPNGYGCIKKLSGNRSRPYAAYPTTAGILYDASTAKSPSAIGYFSDWHSAYTALTEYRRAPYDPKSRNYSFREVYQLLYLSKFENTKKNLSLSSRQAYESAFKNCAALHNIRFLDIRKQEMQDVLDNCTLGYSSVCNLKKLFSQMYRYAMENDIAEKNYAQFVTNDHEDNNEKGEPFSESELNTLWENKKDQTVQMILLMIYSGYRIKAFETIEINTEQQYLKGGVKTSAGKGRIVPIHPAILSFAKSFRKSFPNFRVANFRKTFFYPTLERLGISVTANGKKHTPHDCRHTFSWLCDKYGVDELSKHLLMGHSPGKDIEKAVYGHRTLEELRREIIKIQV